MGKFFKNLFTFGGYSQAKATANAAKMQAEQQEKEYNQKLLEQKEAAILKGEEIGEQVATVNVGGVGSYADDPFTKKRSKFISNSNTLGVV